MDQENVILHIYIHTNTQWNIIHQNKILMFVIMCMNLEDIMLVK